MKITADTNLLVRAITFDDPEQSTLATAELAKAKQVIIPDAVLCELVWVLMRGYRKTSDEIIAVLERLIGSANVVVNDHAARIGISFLSGGGDFADGIIVCQGASSGAEEFVSFDKKAVALSIANNFPARSPT